MTTEIPSSTANPGVVRRWTIVVGVRFFKTIRPLLDDNLYNLSVRISGDVGIVISASGI